jgi:hypothetical protein
MEMTAKGIPLSLRAAFQEYSLEQLDPLEHRFTIMERSSAPPATLILGCLF